MGGVDRGFASDTGIDHGQQGSRDLNELYTPHAMRVDQETHTVGKNRRCSQSSGNKADEISDNTTSEGQDNGVPGAGVGEEEILDFCLAFSRFYRLSGRDCVGEES